MKAPLFKRCQCVGCNAEREHELSRTCGAWICAECGHHKGLARCFCGWAEDGGDGRAQLEDMGETIEPEDY